MATATMCVTEEPSVMDKSDFIKIKCNWETKADKNISDTVSTCATEVVERLGVDDIVNLETCVLLFSNNVETEPCMIDIKVTNTQKIKRLAVVSEATVLEIFKQCGEYSLTLFTDFIDEFENQSVYIGETVMDTPTSEASIKFTKTKRKKPEMWLYGIKLILTEESEEQSTGMLNFDIINSFLTNSKLKHIDRTMAARRVLDTFSISDKCSNLHNLYKKHDMTNLISDSSKQNGKTEDYQPKSLEIENNAIDYKKYIDMKFGEMEKKLAIKIEDMESRINCKLDNIFAILNK